MEIDLKLPKLTKQIKLGQKEPNIAESDCSETKVIYGRKEGSNAVP